MQRPSPGLASQCEGLTTKEESPFPMDTQNPSVRPHAQSRNTGKNHPHRHTNGHARPGGVIHDNTRHTTRFTVIGNHLTQHPDLSLLAIGLACHIQSLPTGAGVDIKTLAARFPEGTTRIAAALRELEAHGYLSRTRERTPTGRIVTRTVSCNQPGRRRDHHTPEAAPPRPPAPRTATAPQRKPARPRALPAVPQPAYSSPTLLQTATEVLVGLRRADPRLLLSWTGSTASLRPCRSTDSSRHPSVGTYFPNRGTLFEETYPEGKAEGKAESILSVRENEASPFPRPPATASPPAPTSTPSPSGSTAP
jgi:hypothetical protein